MTATCKIDLKKSKKDGDVTEVKHVHKLGRVAVMKVVVQAFEFDDFQSLRLIHKYFYDNVCADDKKKTNWTEEEKNEMLGTYEEIQQYSIDNYVPASLLAIYFPGRTGRIITKCMSTKSTLRGRPGDKNYQALSVIFKRLFTQKIAEEESREKSVGVKRKASTSLSQQPTKRKKVEDTAGVPSKNPHIARVKLISQDVIDPRIRRVTPVKTRPVRSVNREPEPEQEQEEQIVDNEFGGPDPVYVEPDPEPIQPARPVYPTQYVQHAQPVQTPQQFVVHPSPNLEPDRVLSDIVSNLSSAYGQEVRVVGSNMDKLTQLTGRPVVIVMTPFAAPDQQQQFMMQQQQQLEQHFVQQQQYQQQPVFYQPQAQPQQPPQQQQPQQQIPMQHSDVDPFDVPQRPPKNISRPAPKHRTQSPPRRRSPDRSNRSFRRSPSPEHRSYRSRSPELPRIPRYSSRRSPSPERNRSSHSRNRIDDRRNYRRSPPRRQASSSEYSAAPKLEPPPFKLPDYICPAESKVKQAPPPWWTGTLELCSSSVTIQIPKMSTRGENSLESATDIRTTESRTETLTHVQEVLDASSSVKVNIFKVYAATHTYLSTLAQLTSALIHKKRYLKARANGMKVDFVPNFPELQKIPQFSALDKEGDPALLYVLLRKKVVDLNL